MKRALVIGGTGFIGLGVVDALLEHGVEVFVTRRKRSITAFVRKRDVTLVPASLDDPKSLEKAMAGCDAVFLAGAYYPRYSLDLDEAVTLGTAGVQNACRAALAAGVPRFIYTSSTGVLGAAPAGRAADERDVSREMPTQSVYRSAKWAMEQEIDRARERGLNVVSMLAGGCLGPGDARLGTGGIVVGTVRGLLPWWVDGTVPLVDVADLAEAQVQAALHPEPAEKYCVSGHDVKVGDLLRLIVKSHGGAMPAEQLSHDDALVRASAEEVEAAANKGRVPVPRELVDLVVAGQPISSALAVRDLRATFRPLSETLDRAHTWFVRHGYLPRPKLEALKEAEA